MDKYAGLDELVWIRGGLNGWICRVGWARMD